jgi:hypothetical protein
LATGRFHRIWQAGGIDLSPFVGQSITIRFVSNPGPIVNQFCNWGAWSALELSVAADDVLNGVTLAVPPALTSKNVAVTGGSASVSSGTATVSGLPSGGTVLVFTGQPKQVTAGSTLIGIPPTAAPQSSADQLAGPNQDGLSGTYGASAVKLTIFSALPAALSWYLQLPASPNLALSFSLTNYTYAGQPVGQPVSVRVNGTALWHYQLNSMPIPIQSPLIWEYGAVDLSPLEWTNGLTGTDLGAEH